MIVLLLFPIKDIASQGINLGMAIVLLLITLFIMYIATYAVIRNRNKTESKSGDENKSEKKVFKKNIKGYDQCELNEIMGYDFIQTQYIGDYIKEKETNENKGERKTYSENDKTETSEINESVFGVTGTENNTPKDEPEETPAERQKRLAELAVMKAQENHTKKFTEKGIQKEEQQENQQEEVPKEYIDLRPELNELDGVNEPWPDNMDSFFENNNEPDPISGDWQESFYSASQKEEMAIATGLIEENNEEDAVEMNNLAGEPDDRDQMNSLLMKTTVFKDMIDPAAFDAAIDDQYGTESHKQFFLEQLRDDYVSQK